MTNIKVLLILSIACYCSYSCNNKTAFSKPEIYVMPKRLAAAKHDRKSYYQTYNFIIDTSSIYFFQEEPYYTKCGEVNWWQEIAIPIYIDLEPKDLVEVPINSVEEFIKANILRTEDWKRTISISSPFDTISSEGLTKIMNLFNDTANHIDFSLRKTTQEENFVLKHKKIAYDYYDHGTLKWDSTKTLFHNVIHDVETEQATNDLNVSDQYYKKMISKETYNKLMLETTDSACLEKVAKRLKVNVDYLFDFEL